MSSARCFPVIRHTVVFRLTPGLGSQAQLNFFKALAALKSIPGVQRFELLRQVSDKASFEFGLSMEFIDQACYCAYNEHPDHIRFVKERWNSEVEAYQELDFVPMD